MREETIDRIRKFNRFYLPEFDLLGNSYLGSEYSATEARVLFEVYTNDGCTAASIAKAMNIDKSYLSRIVRSHENKGFLCRSVSAADRRAYELHLTDSGREATREFIRKSDEQVGAKIQSLTDADCKRLIFALDTVTEILEGKHNENNTL